MTKLLIIALIVFELNGIVWAQSTATEYINEVDTNDCFDPTPTGDFDQCPDDLYEIIDLMHPNGGRACYFGDECENRANPEPGESGKVCPGEDAAGADDQLDIQLEILNSGSATQVPIFEQAGNMESGNQLVSNDVIACFRVDECECIEMGQTWVCKKGGSTIYALHRYKILTRPVCVGVAQ